MNEESTQLPAGYLDFRTVAMHVSKVRNYTDDIERFKKYLPLVLELGYVEPHSEQAYAIYEQADNVYDLGKTLEEVNYLLQENASVPAGVNSQ